MTATHKNPANRYVNDLRRLDYIERQRVHLRSYIVPIGLSVVFLAMVAALAGGEGFLHGPWIVVGAAVVGGYMALNIGANDVANNMGPAVGGKVLKITTAIAIAAVCESAGALLAGGDVVKTISKGIINPGEGITVVEFRYLMLSALLAAALWINLATILSAPVSTTHSIVGGVLGAGVAAAGFDLVNWEMMASIAASWIISPVFGGIIAACLLYFIKLKVLNAEDRIGGAKTWVPILIALMAGAFTAYMAMKGLNKIWHPPGWIIFTATVFTFLVTWFFSRPYIAKKTEGLENRKKDMYGLFDLPLIFGVALLSFAHGANDVANAVGPLAAIVSTFKDEQAIAQSVHIPLWVMVIGSVGIALGLSLFGPKLISVVGEKITRINSPRAYCVALSAAITVLIATTMGLPVSSTHIAVGAVFGVGFLRESLENPNRRKLRPGHKLNHTAAEAFASFKVRRKRHLVRRKFVFSIAAAWIVTVPISALLAAMIYHAAQLL